MSDLVIRDGIGTGNRAQVNDDHQLVVQSTIVTSASYNSSVNGQAIILPANDMTLADTAEKAVLWFKNTDPERVFHINYYYISWNGGNTSYNRTMATRMYKSGTEPTANHYQFTPPSLNLGSSFQPLMTAYVWTGAGSGMTVSSLGTKAHAGYFAPGMTQLSLDGTIIMPFGQVLCATVQGEEAGKASFVISGWYAKV